MFHDNRRWCVTPVQSVDELVDKLLNYSWCCCAAFELGEYVWLNDSTSPDAVQEYAVVHRSVGVAPAYRQVESITVGWCTPQQLTALAHSIHHGSERRAPAEGPVARARSVGDLLEYLGADAAALDAPVQPQLETPETHGRCGHCA